MKHSFVFTLLQIEKTHEIISMFSKAKHCYSIDTSQLISVQYCPSERLQKIVLPKCLLLGAETFSTSNQGSLSAWLGHHRYGEWPLLSSPVLCAVPSVGGRMLTRFSRLQLLS